MAIAASLPKHIALHDRKLVRRGLIALLILWPWLVPAQPWANLAVRMSVWVLAALSLVVLTGWVGQVSLAQAGIMGVGAFTAAQITRHTGLDFPLNIAFAGIASAGIAVAIGIPALRIRGLYLAIATLAFQWALEQSLLQQHWFSGGFNGVKIPDPHIGPYSLTNDRLMYYVAWLLTGTIILLVANLRDSRTGRAWFAIRGSEVAAKTLGINVIRYKLIAFAVSGFILGIAGSINLNFIGQATPLDYNFGKSIQYLSVAVLGGIGAIGGAVLIGIFFVFLDGWFFPEILTSIAGKIGIITAGLLIFTLIRNPGGMITIREDLRRQHLERAARKAARTNRTIVLDAAATDSVLTDGEVTISDDAAPLLPSATENGHTGNGSAERLRALLTERGPRLIRADSPLLLEATDVSVRFGGVVANDEVSLEVRRGEITGLIGPNGAGKTTFFNTVNGLVKPQSGRIRVAGTDITDEPTHARARLGMARTFQIMRLFPRLSVFDNLMIGTHLQNDTGFGGNLLMSGRSRSEDVRLREQVRSTLALLGLERVAHERVAGLPFGILRLVELGRALVSQPKLLLLDEPASGLDVGETDSFAEHLFHTRDELGITILLIEHDVRLVMMACDYVYVMEFGRNLAEGLPSEVQTNEAVVAAYLGEETPALA
ncbi:MAG: ATP-binding cassette domain-containing protein [Actinomycetota bacterium]|nr:branched-chain amino acid ABC transporter ATP-binding protein/permease [Actinomycetota bacterium]